jgi:hypothetical protein
MYPWNGLGLHSPVMLLSPNVWLLLVSWWCHHIDRWHRRLRYGITVIGRNHIDSNAMEQNYTTYGLCSPVTRLFMMISNNLVFWKEPPILHGPIHCRMQLLPPIWPLIEMSHPTLLVSEAGELGNTCGSHAKGQHRAVSPRQRGPPRVKVKHRLLTYFLNLASLLTYFLTVTKITNIYLLNIAFPTF